MQISFKKNTSKKLMTILQYCELSGIQIPRFCYHDFLSISGNCRMCLIELVGAKKLIASCAIDTSIRGVVLTESGAVWASRKAVLEFLLINHPLDCPICDQGGECDSQDLSFIYGRDFGRFFEYKRVVLDKNCGPLIKTIMTRCIHCTRCVRFFTEVAGVPSLGTFGRGSSMEIGFYIDKLLHSEISGNIIDLCPVGALTSRSSAFLTRPWELSRFNHIDVFDSLNSSISIETYGLEVVRILPRMNYKINDEWISDIARYSLEGFSKQRLMSPSIRVRYLGILVICLKYALFSRFFLKSVAKCVIGMSGVSKYCRFRVNHYIRVSWFSLFFNIKSTLIELLDIIRYKSIRYLTFVGGNSNLLGLLPTFSLLNFWSTLGTYSVINPPKNSDFRAYYIAKVDRFENYQAGLLVGINIRLELPILNIRLRKRVINNKLTLFYIGSLCSFNFPIKQLSNSNSIFKKIYNGQHWVCRYLYKNSFILSGTGKEIVNRCFMGLKWISIKNITTNTGLLSAYECGLTEPVHGQNHQFNPVLISFLTCYDTYKYQQSRSSGLLVYQGHTADILAAKADFIIPVNTFLDNSDIYVNTEGFIQKSMNIFNNTSLWSIEKTLQALAIYFKYFNIKKVYIYDKVLCVSISTLVFKYLEKNIKNIYISNICQNYYLNNNFSRLSPSLKASSLFFLNKVYNF